jgi:Protein of unknown function (DUF3025)
MVPPGNFEGSVLVDWSQPWLNHLRETGQAVFHRHSLGLTTHDALNDVNTSPIKFCKQSELPPDKGYEQFIFDTQTVPTRDNLHDFFNGLCWLTFPQTKKKLNQLQAEQLAVGGVRQTRGAVRDALTVFDENAAFLDAPQPLWNALIERNWHRLFVELRPMWKDAQLVLFGHALLEKLVYPRKPITAHVYRAQAAITSIAQLDLWVAADLSADKMASKPFVPLPVLGVPGWWQENEKLSFYEDILVFRPQHQRINKVTKTELTQAMALELGKQHPI